MTVLLVSILWMILDLLKVFFQEHREGPGNEAVRDPGRQKLTQYAEAFEGLSETFLKLPKLKEDLEKEDREEILKETSHQVCGTARPWSGAGASTGRTRSGRRTTGFFLWKKGRRSFHGFPFASARTGFWQSCGLNISLARQNLL